MNYSQIKRLLPHRYPILLLDRVSELETTKLIVAEKNITATELCYQLIDDECYEEDAFHYPNSFIIESFCQAACILALETMKIHIEKMKLLPLFGSINNVKFIRSAKPGDKLIHHVNWVTNIDSTVVVNGIILNGEGTLATIDMVMLTFKSLDEFTK